MQFLSYSSGVMYANEYYPEVIMISASGELLKIKGEQLMAGKNTATHTLE